MVNKFEQDLKLKKGKLSRELGFPLRFSIPQALINAIAQSNIGDIIKNPTQLGRRNIKITISLGKKAKLLKKLHKKKKNNFNAKIESNLKRMSTRNRLARQLVRKKRMEKERIEKQLKKKKKEIDKAKEKILNAVF